jgi:hypothetical protein
LRPSVHPDGAPERGAAEPTRARARGSSALIAISEPGALTASIRRTATALATQASRSSGTSRFGVGPARGHGSR